MVQYWSSKPKATKSQPTAEEGFGDQILWCCQQRKCRILHCAYKKRGSETTGRGENHYHDTNYKKIGFLLLSQASISSTLENPQIFISYME